MYFKRYVFRSNRISDDTINGNSASNVNGVAGVADELEGRAPSAEKPGAEGCRGWHERKRKENVGERERKDSVRPEAWVEARVETTVGTAGVNADGGNRNRNQGAQEHEQTRRRRWRRRRPRYGGSVAFAGSRQGNEMPPSRGGRPFHPREFLPSPPAHRNRRSSPGFPEFSSF